MKKTKKTEKGRKKENKIRKKKGGEKKYKDKRSIDPIV